VTVVTGHQLGRLRTLLATVLESNDFYRSKLKAAGVTAAADVAGADDYGRLPLTTRAELSVDQRANPPYGSDLTYAPSAYSRIHRTSGTTGAPLYWLDTPDSWSWLVNSWSTGLRAAGVTADDCVFCAFSYGPFIGFWCAFEAAQQLGALVIPGGGMTSEQRLQAIADNEATVLLSTPTYALRLAEVAQEAGIDLPGSSLRVSLHGGEPGASLPATRARIEAAWGARSFDHAGATEVGSWGFECQQQAGLHLHEDEFICEVLDPETMAPAAEGELVLTNLGRVGSPLIRYRTGDYVRLADEGCACRCAYRRLDGGVIGRVDGALLIRGVTVFPSAIENVVRTFAEVGEFTVELHRRHEMDDVDLRLEISGPAAEAVARAVADEAHRVLGLRLNARAEAPGSLPRSEPKARRIFDCRA
jgi:phenylacetate-CoA ligase